MPENHVLDDDTGFGPNKCCSAALLKPTANVDSYTKYPRQLHIAAAHRKSHDVQINLKLEPWKSVGGDAAEDSKLLLTPRDKIRMLDHGTVLITSLPANDRSVDTPLWFLLCPAATAVFKSSGRTYQGTE
jgi:hypothetical protein